MATGRHCSIFMLVIFFRNSATVFFRPLHQLVTDDGRDGSSDDETDDQPFHCGFPIGCGRRLDFPAFTEGKGKPHAEGSIAWLFLYRSFVMPIYKIPPRRTGTGSCDKKSLLADQLSRDR